MRSPMTISLAAAALSLALPACFSGAPGGEGGPDGGGGTLGPDGGSLVDPDAAYEPGEERACGAEIRYEPQSSVGVVEIAGEWDGWERHPVEQGADGAYSITMDLEPGLYAYKLVVDDDWILDPDNAYGAYEDGIENSGLRVADCGEPLLELSSFSADTTADGVGSAQARVQFFRGRDGAGFEPNTVSVTRIHNFERIALGSSEASIAGAAVTIDVDGLEEGKHTLVIEAGDQDGRAAEPIRLPFWVEPEAFDWNDPIIYMAMIDRFRDGDPSNNPDPSPEAVESADWYGGDLRGVTDAIEDGYFDELGVRAIWLSPFVDNSRNVMTDGERGVTGYHGYWPRSARVIDPRFGTPEDLEDLVAAAHDRGIRVLKDFVINHIHEDHHYMHEHPEWFQTGCVCGEDCDWTADRLVCLFRPYMPNIDWQNREAGEQMIQDALWWIERFDLDGFRIDAVKHVEDLAIFNLSTRIRERFEQAGTQFFLTGETAMGWGGHDIEDNREEYGTISRYIGPDALDGQKDFVIYHAVSYNVFAFDTYGMQHADFWTQASVDNYPEGAIMTPYIGSHDSTRFATLASGDPNMNNCWPDQPLPEEPSGDEAYERMRVAMSWVLTIPGAPLLYAGDEYGDYGGCDPDNRHMWRPSEQRSSRESALFDVVTRIGQARAESPALRRGDYRSLLGEQGVLAYGRTYNGDAAVVVLNHSGDPVTREVPLAELGAAPDAFIDAIHGGDPLPATGGTVEVTVPARSAAILLPAD